MVLTHISLREAEYHAARREAARLGLSLAELLRRSLRTLLPADPSKPWMRYAGMIETGDPQSSALLDDVSEDFSRCRSSRPAPTSSGPPPCCSVASATSG